MKKFLFLFLVCACSYPVLGDVGRDLTTFFNKLGGAANVSNPGAYQDQTAGYYTGGNVFARNQVHTSQLATIQLPDYRAGCGGIDMCSWGRCRTWWGVRRRLGLICHLKLL